MAPRQQLHDILKGIVGSGHKVYFQPPASIQMTYPCIVYKRDRLDTKFAGNKPYNRVNRYQVTVIYADPDSDIPETLSTLPMCTFDRSYAADNLNHEVYTLYF